MLHPRSNHYIVDSLELLSVCVASFQTYKTHLFSVPEPVARVRLKAAFIAPLHPCDTVHNSVRNDVLENKFLPVSVSPQKFYALGHLFVHNPKEDHALLLDIFYLKTVQG
jgi:hypothetical protein